MSVRCSQFHKMTCSVRRQCHNSRVEGLNSTPNLPWRDAFQELTPFRYDHCKRSYLTSFVRSALGGKFRNYSLLFKMRSRREFCSFTSMSNNSLEASPSATPTMQQLDHQPRKCQVPSPILHLFPKFTKCIQGMLIAHVQLCVTLVVHLHGSFVMRC